MKQLFKTLTASPKTTYGGIVILVAVAMFILKKIDQTAFLSILGLAGGWIGLTASDAKKTDV
jgi:small-conductance mechanosensitive channel